ncbi:DUF1588 domain-containing protein [Blastopirellula marina]|uniref:Cytochrome c domain-containing protein n=1 Tax=Blastopirellula marina TaxID=124 RepID=A0A2S8FTJ1_9BACT|nr:DUF1588 domain-containing protein [Blastopirellula marina]PQO35495.1 hypothetical protein C5Y98_14140 [Blastopirellula marina]PTL44135.1 DUF1588 domain-containing protein [Blastopirellula marina]
MHFLPHQARYGAGSLRVALSTALVLAVCLAAVRADEAPKIDFAAAQKLLETSCADCHSGPEGEGGFTLSDLAESSAMGAKYDEWMKLRTRLADHSMPPADAEPMDADARHQLVDWIKLATRDAVRQQGELAGPPMFRRMAAHEYSNTVRDLLGTHFDAGNGLPQDSAGGEGFNNAGETLIISPIHAEKYVEAAVAALDYAAHDSQARGRLLSERPSDKLPEQDAAKRNLRKFAERAFRRPVKEEELAAIVKTYDEARESGLNYEAACFYAMRGVMLSPNFLFLIEEAPSEPNKSVPLTDHELAARLSYFLWATSPDRALREAADAGKLQDPEELKRQALRMIKERGTRFNDSMTQFVGQWLGTADLGKTKTIDPELHRWMQDQHVASLRDQPVYVFESMIKENDSLLTLIDADWTFLNAELCDVYRLDRRKIQGEFNQRLQRYPLPEEYRYRGGVLGEGGVMAIASYPRRSSPVLRGVWVLDKMLGVELPPPPANVPALEESKEAAAAQTLRARLQQHRDNPNCATCHNRIDPIGFALENFSEIGQWRDKDAGGPIDPVAILPDGTKIDGQAGLKKYLLENQQQFVRHLTQKMLGYALARGLESGDVATVESIVERLQANEYRSQELVLAIVTSEPFRQKRVNQ